MSSAVPIARLGAAAEVTDLASLLDREQPIDQAFPKCDPGIRPTGSRVLVQIRSPKTRTRGGIILAADTTETEKWNQQVGRVVAAGPVAFRNRNTLDPWPEGDWVKPGDFVRVPKYGGDRWERALDAEGREQALFVIFNDLEIIGVVTVDPRDIKAFI